MVNCLHSGSSIALIRGRQSIGSARPHSIWNQISIGLPLARSGICAVTVAAKFF